MLNDVYGNTDELDKENTSPGNAYKRKRSHAVDPEFEPSEESEEEEDLQQLDSVNHEFVSDEDNDFVDMTKVQKPARSRSSDKIGTAEKKKKNQGMCIPGRECCFNISLVFRIRYSCAYQAR